MAVKIFFCYAREDETFLNQLKRHLRPLQHLGLIEVWHDRNISAGNEWDQEIKKHLNEAHIILLLISPDFLDSDYCYSTEMKRAIERHEHGEACVIPIILRHSYWQNILGKLQALPTDAKPVKSWQDQDEAFFNVVEGIHKVLLELSIDKPKPELPSDFIEIVDEARELEKQFQANQYMGISKGQTILEMKGTLPVVISAAHAVQCGTKDHRHKAQKYTGTLALQLATFTGASALVSARLSDEDPQGDEPGLYKSKLANIVRQTHAYFVLDLHGSNENVVRARELGQVELGTAHGKSLRGRDYLQSRLEEALMNAGITVTKDKYFTADKPGTITLYTSEELETPAIQVEITGSFRELDQAPENYVRLLNGLRDAIIAMHTACRDEKN